MPITPQPMRSPALPGGLRLEVVRLGVDDDRAADDRVWAAERDHLVDALVRGLAGRVGFDVAEVADVALGAVGAAVRHAGRVEVAAGALAVGHRAVAEFVNVEAMFAGRQAGELGHDFNAAVLLGEHDFALHLAVAEGVDHANGLRDFGRSLGRRGRRSRLARCIGRDQVADDDGGEGQSGYRDEGPSL